MSIKIFDFTQETYPKGDIQGWKDVSLDILIEKKYIIVLANLSWVFRLLNLNEI